jgi:hypothetical protein
MILDHELFHPIQHLFQKLRRETNILGGNYLDSHKKYWEKMNGYIDSIESIHQVIKIVILPRLKLEKSEKHGTNKLLNSTKMIEIIQSLAVELKIQIILKGIKQVPEVSYSSKTYQDLELMQMKCVLDTILFLKKTKVFKNKQLNSIFETKEVIQRFGWYIAHFKEDTYHCQFNHIHQGFKSSATHFNTVLKHWSLQNLYGLIKAIGMHSFF